MINKSLELLSHIFLHTLYKTTPNSQKQKVSHKDETLYTTWKTVFATAFFNEVFSVTRLVLWRQKIVHFGSFLKALTILQSGNLVTLICIHKMKRKWKTLMKKQKKVHEENLGSEPFVLPGDGGEIYARLTSIFDLFYWSDKKSARTDWFDLYRELLHLRVAH